MPRNKYNLTDKQEKFCQEYMIDLNATQAAIRAGYSAKTAKQAASRLLSNVYIKARLGILKAKAAKKAGVTEEMLTDEYKKIAFGKVSKMLSNRDKVSALGDLGKHTGYFEKDNRQKSSPVEEVIQLMKDAVYKRPSDK